MENFLGSGNGQGPINNEKKLSCARPVRQSEAKLFQEMERLGCGSGKKREKISKKCMARLAEIFTRSISRSERGMVPRYASRLQPGLD
ncbi:hypothetical protein [Thalassospira sp.]|uniref:hypothetical protein n=1 Tax=Thalassospira sp. TaxID=1912094 RepID=UPI000C59F0A1|nr:hypothetical protein [Thalassospira sp.]MBC07427.1 hypothetical protein [Thalassospira sp.]